MNSTRPDHPTRTDRATTDRDTYDRWSSLPGMLFDQVLRQGDRPLLISKQAGDWRRQSWEEVARDVRRAAAGLRGLGVGRGDRVAIVAENRPEWLIADFAIMSLGAVTVPAYTTSTASDHLHTLTDSGAQVVLVSTPALMRKVLPAVLQVRGMRAVVGFNGDMPGMPDGAPEALGWAELLRRGAAQEAERPQGPEDVPAGRDDVACIIYTSGTGGTPKGVMLTHGNILSNCKSAYTLVEDVGLGEETFLSFLPLAHAYEHTCGQMFALTLGARIAYAESVEKLAGNLGEVRPTIMTAVPRLYDVLETRIRREVERAGGVRLALFRRTLELGAKRYRQGGRLGPLDAAQDFVLDRLVRYRICDRFGGRLKAFISGGAALAPETALFFQSLGIRILQGYGQTEASPLIACNRPSRIRHDTVGPPMPDVEVRIAADGEILARGPMVMKGYWGDRDATDRTIVDGWLHTGDIGHLEPDGSLVLTDRKKDLIVTNGGDNIAPQRIENLLMLEPCIGQVMVAGDGKPFLAALIVPDLQLARDWAKRHGKPADPAELAEDADFRKHIGEAVDRVNRGLSGIERIRKFVIVPEPFSVENAQLTPTLKIRRHEIRKRYGELLEELY
ncbi:long-chain fatty acid--CoA ligase [Skermanella rosea]|uniref:AMP-dependent synthetase/ligase n=1 Tax=Skermanella rosea TaxID=1817965 RepID=UPI001932CBC0|nr:long-chain fatty acid--CoA ligase [Skermanella rosea]UEM04901.1 long-chain fatty acid--CoA ligase [Skermanella rosea]